jgi:pantetheine-phosphate adenylyltransferase
MPKDQLNKAICAGSFDPPSWGHINILQRTLNIVDHLIVAIGVNNAKDCTFTVDERIKLLQDIFKDEPRIEIDSFSGLLINYAEKKNVKTLIRGIRTMGDYEYEFQMAHTNRKLNPNIDTIFMVTEGKFSYLSSSIVKQVASLGGSVKKMVPPNVEKALMAKLKN